MASALEKRQAMLATLANKEESIAPASEVANDMVNELYNSSDRLMQMDNALANARMQRQLSKINPYDNNYARAQNAIRFINSKDAFSRLNTFASAMAEKQKAKEWEENNKIQIMQSALLNETQKQKYNAYLAQKEQDKAYLTQEIKQNRYNRELSELNAGMVGDGAAHKFGTLDVIKGRSEEFMGDTAGSLGNVIKGAGDLVEAGLKGTFSDMSYAEAYEDAKANDSWFTPTGAVSKGLLNSSRSWHEDAKARNAKSLVGSAEAIADRFNEGFFSGLSAIGEAAAENIINPETALTMLPGVGLIGKAGSLAARASKFGTSLLPVAGAKANELARERAENKAREEGIELNDPYTLSLEQLAEVSPYALAYSGLNKAELGLATKALGGKAEKFLNPLQRTKTKPNMVGESVEKPVSFWEKSNLGKTLATAKAVERTGRNLATRAAIAGAGEGAIEYAQTHLELMGSNPEMDFDQRHEQAKEAAKMGAIIGGAIGGASSVTAPVANFIRDTHIKTKEKIQNVKEKEQRPTTLSDELNEIISKENHSQQDINRFEEISKELNETSPESLKQVYKNNENFKKNVNTALTNIIIGIKDETKIEQAKNSLDNLSALEKKAVEIRLSSQKELASLIAQKGIKLNSPDNRNNNVDYRANANRAIKIGEKVFNSERQRKAYEYMVNDIADTLTSSNGAKSFRAINADVMVGGNEKFPSIQHFIQTGLSGTTQAKAQAKVKLTRFGISQSNKLKLAKAAKGYNGKEASVFAIEKYTPKAEIKRFNATSKDDFDNSKYHLIQINPNSTQSIKYVDSMIENVSKEMNGIRIAWDLLNETTLNTSKVTPDNNTTKDTFVSQQTENQTNTPATKPKQDTTESKEQSITIQDKQEQNSKQEVKEEPTPQVDNKSTFDRINEESEENTKLQNSIYDENKKLKNKSLLDIKEILDKRQSKSKFNSNANDAMSDVGEFAKSMGMSLKGIIKDFKENVLLRDNKKELARIVRQVSKDGKSFDKVSNTVEILNDDKAIAVSFYRASEAVLNSALMIRKKLDFADIKDMALTLGLDADFLNAKGKEILSNSVFRNAMAESIGKKVLKDLGLKFKDDVDIRDISRLEIEIGINALHTLSRQGVIEFTSVNAKDLTDDEVENRYFSFVLAKNIKKLGNKAKALKALQELGEKLNIEEEIQSPSYRLSPAKTSNIAFIKDTGKVKLDKDKTEALKTQKETAFNLAYSENLKELIKDESFIKDLKIALGYKSKYQSSNMHEANYVLPSEINSIEGKNQQIDEDVKVLLDFMASEDTKKDLYFDFSVARNARMFMQSVGINPQQNKFFRFLFPTKASLRNITLEKGELPAVNYLAIAQAFGFATDKKAQEDSLKFAKNMVGAFIKKQDNKYSLDTKALSEFFANGAKGVINEEEIHAEHPTHLITTLYDIASYLNAKEQGKNSFKAHFLYEADGVNNGLVVKGLNFINTSSNIKNLSSAGVQIGNVDNNLYVNKIANKIEQDYYQKVARELNNAIKTDGKSYILEKLKENLALAEDGSVTKKARSLAKAPTTVFGYSAGDRAISSAFLEDIISDIPNKILNFIKNKGIDEKGKMNESVEGFKEYELVYKLLKNSGATNIHKDILARLTSEEGLLNTTLYAPRKNDGKKVKRNIYSVFQTEFADRVSDILDKSLQSVFEGFVVRNNAINAIYNLSAKIMSNKLLQKIEEVDKSKEKLTKQKYDEIVNEITNLPFATTLIDSTTLKSLFPIYSFVNIGTNDSFSVAAGKNEKGYANNFNITPQVKGFGELGKSANVLAIHTMDARIMAETILKANGEILQVMDALIGNVSDVVASAKEYNTHLIENSLNSNILNKALSMYDAILKENLVDMKDLEIQTHNEPILKAMIDTNDKIKEYLNDYADISSENLNSSAMAGKGIRRANKESLSQAEILKGIDNIKAKAYKELASKFGLPKKTTLKANLASWESLENNVYETIANIENYDLSQRTSVKDKLYFSPDNSGVESESIIVDKENITTNIEQIGEIFNKLDSMERFNENYDEEHSSYLKNMLNELVPNGANLKGLDIKISQNKSSINTGEYDLDSHSVNISLGENVSKARLSGVETYAHEINHALILFGQRILLKTNKSVKELINLHKYAISKLSWQDFLPEYSSGDINIDEQIAKERFDHIKLGNENGIAEFVAMGTTHKKLMNKLKEIALQKNEKEYSNVYEKMFIKVKNILVDAFNKIRNKEKSKTAYDELMRLNKEIIKANLKADSTTQKRISYLNALMQVSLEKANDSLLKIMNNYIDYVKESGAKLELEYIDENSSMYKKLKNILKAIMMSQMDEKNAKEARDFLDKIGLAEYGDTAQSILDDISKPDDIKRALEKMARLSRRIDAKKQAMQVANEEVLNELFDNGINENTAKELGLAVLDTDLVSLVDSFSTQDIKGLLQDSNKLNKEINNSYDKIATLHEKRKSKVDKKAFINFVKAQAEGLASFMSSGVATNGGQLLNAHNIASIYGSSFKSASFKELEYEIDKLISLISLKNLSEQKKDVVVNTMNNYPVGFDKLLNFAKNNKIKAKDVLFKHSPQNYIKGYRADIYNSDIDIKIASIDDTKELENLGYEVLDDNLVKDDSDSIGTQRAIFINREFKVQNTYTQGAARLKDNHSKGSDFKSLFINEVLAGRAKEDDLKISLKKAELKHKKAINSMLKGEKIEKSIAMVPILDNNGNFENFRYTMPKGVKLKYLDLDTNIFKAMSKENINSFDKIQSVLHNENVANILYDDYVKNYSKNKNSYVELSAYSKDDRIKDIYNILPYSLKDTLNKLYDNSSVMVRKDILYRTFGFRDLDIKESKIYSYSKSSKLKWSIRTADALSKKLGAIYKTNVVVKMPATILGNIVSNISQSFMQGMSPVEILKNQNEAIDLLRSYREDILSLQKINAKEMAGIKINETEKENLILTLKNNPILPLMSEGLFTAIVEDVNIEQSSKKDKIDVKSENIRQVVRNINPIFADSIDIAFISKNTALYQTMEKIIQSSDFIARYAMYKSLLEKGIEHNKAIDIVSDSFINYDIPFSPALKYVNDRAYLPFTKFFTRIQRVLKNEIVFKKPANALLMLLSQRLSNIDISDPFEASVIDKNYGFMLHNPLEIGTTAITPSIKNFL